VDARSRNVDKESRKMETSAATTSPCDFAEANGIQPHGGQATNETSHELLSHTETVLELLMRAT
jgi:hypothetical protein